MLFKPITIQRTYFRAEIFIVSAIIAWTYLLHAYFKKKKIDYRFYKKGKSAKKEILKTKNGAERYLGLLDCLNKKECEIDEVTKKNLQYLIEIRDEIEHRCTQRIDSAISAKLQACCTNFNTYIKRHFGNKLGLDNELSFALQFSHLSLVQQQHMALSQDLPDNIAVAQENFENTLTEEQYNDPRYAIRVRLSMVKSNSKKTSDNFVVLSPYDNEQANQASSIVLKKIEPLKFLPSEIVRIIKDKGFLKFRIYEHTQLVKLLKAKHGQDINDRGGEYGIWIGKSWYYYENWINKVAHHCTISGEKYR